MAKAVKQVEPTTGTEPETPKTPVSPETLAVENKELMEILSNIATGMSKLTDRVERMENGGKNDFKREVKSEDITAAQSGREGVDSRIVKIVDEMLGEDFRIRLEPHKDGRLGYLFTLVVPPRLSDLGSAQRPVTGEDGKYKKNEDGSFVLETYQPEDFRSRAISSAGNLEDIKEHCERVRAHIVSYYTKMSKPLPEFKIK